MFFSTIRLFLFGYTKKKGIFDIKLLIILFRVCKILVCEKKNKTKQKPNFILWKSNFLKKVEEVRLFTAIQSHKTYCWRNSRGSLLLHFLRPVQWLPELLILSLPSRYSFSISLAKKKKLHFSNFSIAHLC